MSYTKHRDETIKLAVDFAARLNAGETLASVDALRVHDADGVNVSAQFGAPTGAINGTLVEFTLADAAGPTDQVRGIYLVFCQVTTSLPQELVETPTLVLLSEASVT